MSLATCFAGYDNADVVAAFDGTMNGYAVRRDRRTTVPIQDVAPPGGSLVLKGQGVVGARENPSAFNAYGYVFSNSTPRPAGADRQRVKFTFYTGTLFDAGSNLDHVPVMLYFHAQAGSDGFRSNPYDGIGIFFSWPQWYSNACHNTDSTGGQIFIERFAAPPGTPGGFDADNCRSNLARPLRSRHYYDVTITATDAAVLDVAVSDHTTHAVLPLAVAGALPYSFAGKYACPLVADSADTATLYCDSPYSPDRYANFRTGYAVWPMFQDIPAASGTGVGSFSNFTAQWLDKNGRVLWSQ